MARKLTNKQKVFVENYLTYWNASEAARRAGYVGRANTVGPRLLSNVVISEEITRRLAELQITADEVLTRLAGHARGSMEDFLNPDTNELDLAGARNAKMLHLVKSYKRSTGKTNTVSVELYDAQQALTTLGKHLKLFGDDEDGRRVELRIVYVNDWRNPAADAPSGPALRDEPCQEDQSSPGGPPVAENHDVHVDLR